MVPTLVLLGLVGRARADIPILAIYQRWYQRWYNYQDEAVAVVQDQEDTPFPFR